MDRLIAQAEIRKLQKELEMISLRLRYLTTRIDKEIENNYIGRTDEQQYLE